MVARIVVDSSMVLRTIPLVLSRVGVGVSEGIQDLTYQLDCKSIECLVNVLTCWSRSRLVVQ